MLKLLLVGDPHLGKTPTYLLPGEWRGYVLAMLLTALKEAVRLGADAVVLMGDVFDNNSPCPEDHEAFTDFVFTAREMGVLVITFPGNHDYLNRTSHALLPYRKMRGMIQIVEEPVSLEIKGVSVKLFPWSPPDVQHNLGKLDTKRPSIVLHHEEAYGAKMDNGWVADGFKPRKAHFYAGGHLHTWQLVTDRSMFVGTALSSHWNHKPKGFTLLTAKEKGSILTVKHAQIEYAPPFLLREVPLAKFPVGQKDKVKTYYRVLLKPGEAMPDDKRIVSAKTIGSPKTEVVDTTSKHLDTLPNPAAWLLSNVPEEKRKRAKRLLASVPRNTEED